MQDQGDDGKKEGTKTPNAPHHGYGLNLEDAAEEDGGGVPMEHLITCVRGLSIQHGVSGTKSVVAAPGFESVYGGGGGLDDSVLNSSNSGSTASLPSVVSSGASGDVGMNARQQQPPPFYHNSSGGGHHHHLQQMAHPGMFRL